MIDDGFSLGPSGLEIVGRGDGGLIRTLEEWRLKAPPFGGDRQWADGYSAKETARAWLASGRPAVPPELARLLASSPLTGDIAVSKAFPEHDTRLPERGGPRRHDLLLLASGERGRVVVGVESKTDEPFDDPLWAALAATVAERANPRTRKGHRVQALCRGLFGRAAVTRTETGRVIVDAGLAELPYQLVAGAAGTLIEAAARRATIAILAVHSLEPENADPAAVAANQQAFAAFAAALGLPEPESGQLAGPVTIPGGHGLPSSVPLLVGYVRSPLPRRTGTRRARRLPDRSEFETKLANGRLDVLADDDAPSSAAGAR